MKTYSAAVVVEIGLPPAPGPRQVLAAAFFVGAESEEAAETDCLQQTRESMLRIYGLAEGDRWQVLSFSAVEVPLDTLREVVGRHGA